MGQAGLREARTLHERPLLFGLLRIGYYRAFAP
jgi:hypothetical protein